MQDYVLWLIAPAATDYENKITDFFSVSIVTI